LQSNHQAYPLLVLQDYPVKHSRFLPINQIEYLTIQVVLRGCFCRSRVLLRASLTSGRVRSVFA